MAARVLSSVLFGQSELGPYYIKDSIRYSGLIFEYRYIRVYNYIAIERL